MLTFAKTYQAADAILGDPNRGGGRGRDARSRKGVGGAIGKNRISGSKKAGIRSNKKLVNSLEKASVKHTESRN